MEDADIIDKLDEDLKEVRDLLESPYQRVPKKEEGEEEEEEERDDNEEEEEEEEGDDNVGGVEENEDEIVEEEAPKAKKQRKQAEQDEDDDYDNILKMLAADSYAFVFSIVLYLFTFAGERNRPTASRQQRSWLSRPRRNSRRWKRHGNGVCAASTTRITRAATRTTTTKRAARPKRYTKLL